MPTYQYACTECGHRFEAVQSFHEDSLTHCPECDGRLRKVFNAVGVVFKGSGFYRNDSRSGAASDVLRLRQGVLEGLRQGLRVGGLRIVGLRLLDRGLPEERDVLDARGGARLVDPVDLDPRLALVLVVLTLWRGRPRAAPVRLRSTACPTPRSHAGARRRAGTGSLVD